MKDRWQKSKGNVFSFISLKRKSFNTRYTSKLHFIKSDFIARFIQYAQYTILYYILYVISTGQFCDQIAVACSIVSSIMYMYVYDVYIINIHRSGNRLLLLL